MRRKIQDKSSENIFYSHHCMGIWLDIFFGILCHFDRLRRPN